MKGKLSCRYVRSGSNVEFFMRRTKLSDESLDHVPSVRFRRIDDLKMPRFIPLSYSMG